MGMMNEDRIVLSLCFTYTSLYLQSVTWIRNEIGIQVKANEYCLRFIAKTQSSAQAFTLLMPSIEHHNL